MTALALGGILALAVRRIIHARRALADAFNLDGDPDTCRMSWCPLDHSDLDICGEPFRTVAGTLHICTLTEWHDGHHHDTDSDARWSRRWVA